MLGAIGDFGCFSFHETKNYSMGEGGALLIKDRKNVERAEIIREKGTNRSKFFRGEIDKYTWVDFGSSYLPSELNAAYLWAQLEQEETCLLYTSNITSHRIILVIHIVKLTISNFQYIKNFFQFVYTSYTRTQTDRLPI